MIDIALFVLTLISALGCGLIAGVFFAFSAFVMRALARLPASQGIAAMQAINIAVINPVFMSVFLGTAVACAGLVAISMFTWHGPGAVWLIVGGLLYLVGTFGVTIVFNVPRNNSLAAIDPAKPDAAGKWAAYVSSWTAWNHVRTVAALAAAALLSIGLYLQY